MYATDRNKGKQGQPFGERNAKSTEHLVPVVDVSGKVI
jgi:hypothetical protein